MDRTQADPTFTQDNLYLRAHARLFYSSNVTTAVDFRIATFNAASGAFVSAALRGTTTASGVEFEIHALLPPATKDKALDDVIKKVRIREEIGLPSVDGALFYTMEAAASPRYIVDVLDAYYFANPDGSINRDKRYFEHWEMVTTATARELRVSPALTNSQQVVLDAILAVSLGASELATINIPDENWILAGAEALCWHRLVSDGPQENIDEYRRKRAEAAAEFSRLTRSYAPSVSKSIQFSENW